jgi:hypothetical protein
MEEQQQAPENMEPFVDDEPMFVDPPDQAEPEPAPAVAEPEPEPDPQPDPEPEPAPEPERDLAPEDRARAMGWVPKEEWRGDPGRWRPAEEFLEVSEKSVPMMKKDRDRLIQKVSELEGKLDAFHEYHEQDRRRTQERAYRKAVLELKAKQKEAVESGDVDTYNQTEQQLANLYKENQEQEQQAQQQAQQLQQKAQATGAGNDYVEWQKANPWYTHNTDLRVLAHSLANYVAFENPHVDQTSKKFFDMVRDQVFQHPKFKNHPTNVNQRRQAAPAVAAGAGTSAARGSGAGKGFGELPKEAQSEALRLERHGIMKRAQYTKEYFGEDDMALTIEDL